MRNKLIWILSLGHMVTDINQGALPALLPFFIAACDLSYTAAATIVLAANLASSIIQPLFGYAADRFSKPWLLWAGLLLAGIGLGMTGLFENYPLILGLAIVSGIGIAAYHPEAAKQVNAHSGSRKNTAMSIFGVGGTIGFAIGPFLVTSAMIFWGLKGTLILIVPVSIMALYMISQVSKLERVEGKSDCQDSGATGQVGTENWPAFTQLTLVVIGRSIVFYGLNTFISLYWIDHLHQSKIMGSTALTIFAVSGVLGNLMGGTLADRFGSKKILLFGFAGLAVLLPLFCMVDHAMLSLCLVFPIGIILYASYSPSIVLGQSYLPNRVGLSSGVTLGVAISIGGAATPIIGKIADAYGVWAGIMSLACLPPILFALAMGLPEPQPGDDTINRVTSADSGSVLNSDGQ
ncbi:MAG: MFS transporter [Desulfobacteraceae bacterium]|nr:MAG: MFS transporter [Desulfobacteraceae bacterium]